MDILDQIRFQEILLNPEHLKTITLSEDLKEAILQSAFNSHMIFTDSNDMILKWQDPAFKQSLVNMLLMNNLIKQIPK